MEAQKTLRDQDLLTIPEGSQVVRLKPSTLRAAILNRRIPYVKLLGRVFLRRSDLEKMITDSIVPALPKK